MSASSAQSIGWADRGPFWNFHGLWENRLTTMSEAAIWTHDVRPVIARLTKPTLMVHADRAASGPQVPKDLFEIIPATRKELVWLGSQNQLQFYEDPITIDQVVRRVARFFSSSTDGRRATFRSRPCASGQHGMRTPTTDIAAFRCRRDVPAVTRN